MPDYLLALGSNEPGILGASDTTLDDALIQFGAQRWVVKAVSRRFDTRAVTTTRQPRYINMAALVSIPLPPARVLNILKSFERRAGRVRVRSRGSRPLDIDIIDCPSFRVGWDRPARAIAKAGTRPYLVLPHPLAHTRAFVLDPLADVSPRWWHRGLRQPLTRLRHALPRPPGLLRPR